MSLFRKSTLLSQGTPLPTPSTVEDAFQSSVGKDDCTDWFSYRYYARLVIAALRRIQPMTDAVEQRRHCVEVCAQILITDDDPINEWRTLAGLQPLMNVVSTIVIKAVEAGFTAEDFAGYVDEAPSQTRDRPSQSAR